jgi:hypothetical protein
MEWGRAVLSGMPTRPHSSLYPGIAHPGMACSMAWSQTKDPVEAPQRLTT